MEEERKKELFCQARDIYTSATGCMPGLEQWADSFKGTDEYLFAKGLCDFINSENTRHVSSRVFDIDFILQNEFLDYLSLSNVNH